MVITNNLKSTRNDPATKVGFNFLSFLKAVVKDLDLISETNVITLTIKDTAEDVSELYHKSSFMDGIEHYFK